VFAVGLIAGVGAASSAVFLQWPDFLSPGIAVKPVANTSLQGPIPASLGMKSDVCVSGQPVTGAYAADPGASGPTAALTIITTGSRDSHFVVLEDASNGRPVASFYVQAGGTLQTEAPVGTYILRYAEGKSWCNAKRLFGKDTVMAELDLAGTDTPNPLRFVHETGVTSSVKVWLSSKPDDGIARARSIPPGQFWNGKSKG